VLATDDRTVCMVERAGRCASVDADSGQVLWTARLQVTRIADATVSGGQLIVVGEFAQPQADNKVDRVALLDARAGTPLAVTAAPITGVRYMRTTTRGDLILGAGGTIVAVNAADLETARTAWTLTGHPAANAWEAWLLDDRLFLLGDDRSLWEVPAGSGVAPERPIDVQGKLDARTGIAVWQSGSGTVAFATGRGVAIIGGKGTLVGADAVNATEGTVMPVVADGAALLLAPAAQRQTGMMMGDGGGTVPQQWALHRLDSSGAQLLSTTAISFASPPMRMGAIDGRIAVSTSSGTVVFDAPSEAR
ncbi:MAG TPA: PQQ-binding-like beta-propeller repeat protein, partial [Phycisphaerales bacterium]|nr:PQQ-binding-like beta-propeller repeat protein [Phycisphaerales bacterium]